MGVSVRQPEVRAQQAQWCGARGVDREGADQSTNASSQTSTRASERRDRGRNDREEALPKSDPIQKIGKVAEDEIRGHQEPSLKLEAQNEPSPNLQPQVSQPEDKDTAKPAMLFVPPQPRSRNAGSGLSASRWADEPDEATNQAVPCAEPTHKLDAPPDASKPSTSRVTTGLNASRWADEPDDAEPRKAIKAPKVHSKPFVPAASIANKQSQGQQPAQRMSTEDNVREPPKRSEGVANAR